ncbi:NAD(+)--dinitrogen-reductase ADP-D-ribosyltransferase [Shewanella sp. C32]|uniref:NAD(+)--dinitrogen-reductase ADP-D-ribosyltransferase n=1 Tax=Shewanella electrica TaxID=515560 RepID=A0ABT2FJQ7_9GAMM|nr:NAD(+)--dinitrogen-reductase ADP-D-ribosyltransferase [Shewanella electrica]MCH1924335.1 NAD(+)--dinitrogen-reductase ADP-D-ribosyltransferase [Shewanella electrica]MCS4556236.1 NAD(+)--dinitrogen-reductase ADP-D-ribosyltransferase [Shewanella electrica]
MTSEYAADAAELQRLTQLCIPFNRCNVPAWLLASTGYQARPIPLLLDSIVTWYQPLFDELALLPDAGARADAFERFMQQRFDLSTLADEPPQRAKLHYRRMIIGWLFDSDNDQGAAWRSWAESRFGLLTQFHRQPLSTPDSTSYGRYRQHSFAATNNSNELFEQLDLLYQFCQLQLTLSPQAPSHLTLYRGCAHLEELSDIAAGVVQFNNLSSFAATAESAAQFGSCVYQVAVPLSKIVCYESLLPNIMTGEQEFMVLGGLYRSRLLRV